MSIYVFLFVILLVLSSIEVLYQNKKMVIVGGILLAVFAGFRYYTGYDFASYKTFFDQMTGIQDVFNGSLDAESGYLFLNYIFLKMGLNYFAFVLFFAFVSIGLLVNFLYRNVPYPTLILLYYFARFFMARDMGQIRGSLASIILLYSIKYMKERQLFKFLAIVLLASFFHLTALIFILGYVYEVYFSDISNKKILALIWGSHRDRGTRPGAEPLSLGSARQIYRLFRQSFLYKREMADEPCALDAVVDLFWGHPIHEYTQRRGVPDVSQSLFPGFLEPDRFREPLDGRRKIELAFCDL